MTKLIRRFIWVAGGSSLERETEVGCVLIRMGGYL